eukprot:PITA_32804
MNPALRDIVKEEVRKLLDAGFIYPISDSQWVSPLVLVPKKDGTWNICIDYQELNKATLKDYFPLPFIDQFISNLVQGVMEQYNIRYQKSTPYHLQANGQVESTNKVIESILTKTANMHRKDWDERLPKAFWAYRNTWRNSTRNSPYELVYGKQVLLPIEFQIKTFRIAVQLGLDLSEA